MRIIQNSSIRFKLVAIILIVTIISLLGGFSFEIINNIKNLKKDLENNLSLNAKLISGFAVPTLLFDDRQEASVILNKLNNIPFVLYGCISDDSGSVFAEYFKAGYEDNSGLRYPDTINNLKNKLFSFTEPVVSDNKIIGNVYMVASIETIRDKVIGHIKSVLLIFFITSAFAIFLTFLLERIISGPILNLANITKIIQATGDYSIRVRKKSHDEIGMLYDNFNELLKSLEVRIKERDAAEKALMEEKENLERKVKERTMELNAAKDKAEEADRLKSSFLANMSHEIRTPLNAILGFSELIATGMTSPEEKEYALNCINESKDDLIQVIENVLDTSSIETNQFYINKSEFVINKELESLIKQNQERLIRKNKESVQFISRLESTEGAKILTDGQRVKRVLNLLIDNAIKYTDQGIIELGTFVRQPDEVGFYVKDTGCGIHDDEKDKIFNRFYKIETDKNRLYRGAGLGLTLASGIVNALGGKIWLESESGAGSVFYFTVRGAVSVSEKVTGYVKYEDQIQVLKGRRILVVEDNFTNLALICEVLKKYNIETERAKNGLEAIELVGKNKFDLILMDILMPEMDGFAATKRIKISHPGIPVVALTAFNFSMEDNNLKELFDAYLFKPVKLEDLIKTIIAFFI